MDNINVNRVIEEFSHFPLKDMEYVAEIIKKQIIDAKRDALVVRIREAKTNYAKGRTKRGTAKDLMEDLEG